MLLLLLLLPPPPPLPLPFKLEALLDGGLLVVLLRAPRAGANEVGEPGAAR